MEITNDMKKVFDPKYRSFSWALAEAQERRESSEARNMALLEECMARVPVEESLKKLLEED